MARCCTPLMGDRTWGEQTSGTGTDDSLLSVHFVSESQGWVVGVNRTVLRINAIPRTSLQEAKDIAAYKAALDTLAREKFLLPVAQQEYEETIEKAVKPLSIEIAQLEAEQEKLRVGESTPSKTSGHDLYQQYSDSSRGDRFCGLFYCSFSESLSLQQPLRLSAFYSSRADALALATPDMPYFVETVDKLGPDNMGFDKRAQTPTAEVIDAVKKLSQSGAK